MTSAELFVEGIAIIARGEPFSFSNTIKSFSKIFLHQFFILDKGATPTCEVRASFGEAQGVVFQWDNNSHLSRFTSFVYVIMKKKHPVSTIDFWGSCSLCSRSDYRNRALQIIVYSPLSLLLSLTCHTVDCNAPIL